MIKDFSYNDVSLALEKFAINELQLLGLNFDPHASAYMQLCNYLSKLIKLKPRHVTKSKSFSIPDDLLIGFQTLVKKIESGEDINIYLSKGIEKTMFADRFLDDFGCFHFHLGETLKGKYIKRTGPVALAYVTDDEIFFIETKQHGPQAPYTWSNKSVLEVLHRERPHFIIQNKVTFLKNVSPEISNETDIKNLRKNIYTFGVTLDDGSVYMPSKFGQVTVKAFKNREATTLASEHMLRMTACSREIYFSINSYIKKFKLQNNCTITNVSLCDFKSNYNSRFYLQELSFEISYLKGFELGKVKLALNL